MRDSVHEIRLAARAKNRRIQGARSNLIKALHALERGEQAWIALGHAMIAVVLLGGIEGADARVCKAFGVSE